jgi:hypothetical protein
VPDIGAHLDAVAALDPRQVVDELGVPAYAAARTTFGKAREQVDIEVGKRVEEDVALDILQVEGISITVLKTNKMM